MIVINQIFTLIIFNYFINYLLNTYYSILMFILLFILLLFFLVSLYEIYNLKQNNACKIYRIYFAFTWVNTS